MRLYQDHPPSSMRLTHRWHLLCLLTAGSSTSSVPGASLCSFSTSLLHPPPSVMNPYGNTNLTSHPHDVAAPGSVPSSPPVSVPGLCDNSNNPSSSRLPCPPVIQTGHSSILNSSAYQASSDKHEEQNLVPSPNPDHSTLPLPGSAFNLSSRSLSSLAPVSPQSWTPSPVPSSTPNPYPAPDIPPTCHVSVIIPSPDPRPPPLTSQCSEESCPDLECSICFSQFNNIFRCPKMLHCKHTFCLECLARINVKSAAPSAVQCPLCRSFTPLPALGLPKLTTDSDVLSYLPAAMQRVYSIRFLRNKGKLEVKRSGCLNNLSGVSICDCKQWLDNVCCVVFRCAIHKCHID